MGELEVRRASIVGFNTPAGADPEEMDWYPIEERPWDRIDQLPAEILRQMHSVSAFPEELYMYGWTFIHTKDSGRRAGRRTFRLWLAGSDGASITEFFENVSGQWEWSGTDRQGFRQKAVFKKRDFASDPETDGEDVGVGAGFGINLGSASVLPAQVRQQIAAIYPWTEEPTESLVRWEPNFPAAEGSKVGYEYAGIFQGRGQVIAIKATRLTTLLSGTSKTQAFGLLDRELWTVQVVHGVVA